MQQTLLLKSKPIVDFFLLNYKVSNSSVKARLDIFLIGGDTSSQIYVNKKKEFAGSLGITTVVHKYDTSAGQEFLESEIKKVSDNPEVSGIIIQLPIDKSLNVRELYNRIDPKKDIESLSDINVSKREYGEKTYLPATARAVKSIFDFYQIEIEGLHVVMIGNSDIVGKPIANMCLEKKATVTICHEFTKDLQSITKTADIIIVAIGKPKFIDQTYFRNDKTQVVIDIGITDIGLDAKTGKRKVSGDVDFENVKDRVLTITPVPGGVGPLTVLSLIENLLESVV
jgi:methylenetetrahydrofolate dehydrogenase (NADP+) / methenyltetrahydrofolate cyclohydrolase